MNHSTSMLSHEGREMKPFLTRLFTAHPAEAGETYLQHLWFTVGMSSRFVIVSAILMMHGLLPFLFTHTASSRIERIYLIMRRRAARTQVSGAGMYDI